MLSPSISLSPKRVFLGLTRVMAGVFYSKEQVRDLSQSAPRGSAYE